MINSAKKTLNNKERKMNWYIVFPDSFSRVIIDSIKPLSLWDHGYGNYNIRLSIAAGIRFSSLHDNYITLVYCHFGQVREITSLQPRSVCISRCVVTIESEMKRSFESRPIDHPVKYNYHPLHSMSPLSCRVAPSTGTARLAYTDNINFRYAPAIRMATHHYCDHLNFPV